jgi:hypothetical protein
LKAADERRAAYERDGWRCVDCGMANDEHVRYFARSLDAHRVRQGGKYVRGNLVTLCKCCHRARHGARAFDARVRRSKEVGRMAAQRHRKAWLLPRKKILENS